MSNNMREGRFSDASGVLQRGPANLFISAVQLDFGSGVSWGGRRVSWREAWGASGVEWGGVG